MYITPEQKEYFRKKYIKKTIQERCCRLCENRMHAITTTMEWMPKCFKHKYMTCLNFSPIINKKG